MEHESAWKKYSDKDVKTVYDYADGYMKFLSTNLKQRIQDHPQPLRY